MKEVKERRTTLEPITIELRDDATDASVKNEIIQGYFAVYDKFYEMWDGYKERIAKGAFDGCDFSDVVALFNHEDEQLLGRTYNNEGTLELSFDENGGYFKVPKNDTTPSKDCYINIQLKNIRGCSFAFTVKEQNVEYDVPQADGSEVTIRTITKIGKLYDVGPVVNPAYQDTEVEACKRSITAGKPAPVIVPQITRETQLLNLRTRK